MILTVRETRNDNNRILSYTLGIFVATSALTYIADQSGDPRAKLKAHLEMGDTLYWYETYKPLVSRKQVSDTRRRNTPNDVRDA